MDAPGGVAVRPLKKIYNPTFWPLQHFVHMRDGADGKGLALFLALPSAISCSSDGRLEIVALRNAIQERALGFIPLLGLPASGHEQSIHTFDYALLFTEAGDWRDNSIPLLARNIFNTPGDTSSHSELHNMAASLVTTNRPDVFVTAVKPASRGQGLIVRLFTYTSFGATVDVTTPNHTLKAAFLCDARERDLQPLQISEQSARLNMPGAFATIRLFA
jgi:alpha-mannosidase